MKANSPSLFLYFTVCVLVVFFKIIEKDAIVLYLKSIVIPLIFIYYLISNNYKITLFKSLIFFFCFVGDIYNALDFNDSGLGALLSFLMVYLMMLKLAVSNFLEIKIRKKDFISLLILFFFILSITSSILSLRFERMEIDFTIYVIYGVALSALGFFSIANFIKKGNHSFFNLVLMSVCFMISDITYVINKFYFSLYIFSFTSVTVQVFSYYFMVTYFLENDKFEKRKLSYSKITV